MNHDKSHSKHEKASYNDILQCIVLECVLYGSSSFNCLGSCGHGTPFPTLSPHAHNSDSIELHKGEGSK